MPQSFSIQTTAVAAAFARVVFEKKSDRWSHRFEWVTSGKPVLVATSIEGTSDSDWPPSQPLQEITQAYVGEQPVLLGIGMAGRSHWSLSCSHEPDSIEHPDSIFFELACLVKTTPAGWLGSSYQLGKNVKIGNCSDEEVRLRMDNNDEILISARNSHGTDENWGTRFQINDRQLQIRPAVISKSPTAATRWAFAMGAAKNRFDATKW